MGCYSCSFLEIGTIYRIEGNCFECGVEIRATGAYTGLVEGFHMFRLHPKFNCPKCGQLRAYSQTPCDDASIDVTEEFHIMKFGRKSHWVGE